MNPPTPPRTLDDLADRNPKLRAQVEAVRAAIPQQPLREPIAPEETA